MATKATKVTATVVDTETTHPRTQPLIPALDHTATTTTPSPTQAATEAQTTTTIAPAEAMAARMITAPVARATRPVVVMEGARRTRARAE